MGEQADPFAVSAIGRLWPSGPVEGGDEVADPSGIQSQVVCRDFCLQRISLKLCVRACVGRGHSGIQGEVWWGRTWERQAWQWSARMWGLGRGDDCWASMGTNGGTP